MAEEKKNLTQDQFTEEMLDIMNDGGYTKDMAEGEESTRFLTSIEQDTVIPIEYATGTVDVLFRPDPGADANTYMGVDDNFKMTLKQQTFVAEGDILVEQDVPVTMRDGAKIYVDIFRPANTTEKVPAIIAWGFYGKGDSDEASDWAAMGVPTGALSKFMKFEAADPGYWVRKGYAVINVDSRGAGNSDGNVILFGKQDGEDGYDTIEWLASRHWCNGKVGMYGNSALAMCQWWIAAEQPPHLACIAPWEGTSDLYREFILEGGIPWPAFSNMAWNGIRTHHLIEDMQNMCYKYPLMNPYWEDKIPDFKKIEVPAYVSGGFCHFHLRGSVNGWRKMKSKKKWLRLHREFEWTDGINRENLADLTLFFERYLKGVYNGWETTPKVRLQVMDAYDHDYQTNRPEDAFPLKRTQYKKLYLNAEDCSLNWDPVANESCVSYDSEKGVVNFDIKFEEETEISGFMSLHLNVAAESYNDMDMFFNIEKLDENGEMLPVSVVGEPHPGAWGRIRVSHRELDPELSTKFQPVMAHRRELKLEPGEIVPIDVEIAPHSRIWHKGQTLRIEVAGRWIRDENWFYAFPCDTDNKGNHLIYTGGKYDSYIKIPVIPPKYVAGDYVFR